MPESGVSQAIHGRVAQTEVQSRKRVEEKPALDIGLPRLPVFR